MLQPQEAPKIKKREASTEPVITRHPAGSAKLPWEDGLTFIQRRMSLPPNYEWAHQMFVVAYPSDFVSKSLSKLFGQSQGYTEGSRGDSAAFCLRFSHEGRFIAGSLVLSSEAWFLGQNLNPPQQPISFEKQQDELSKKMDTILEGVINPGQVHAAVIEVLSEIGLENLLKNPGIDLVFKSQPTRKSAARETNTADKDDDPLNSFFLEDLMWVATRLENGEISKPLKLYLSQHNAGNRTSMSGANWEQKRLRAVHPPMYPLGCWPTEAHRGLVLSQQVAVNLAFYLFEDGHKIAGINGPPGTGKTTLLRDVVAEIIVKRSRALAQFKRPSDAFDKTGRTEINSQGASLVAYNLKDELFGFEIALASSNNGAVENVTLELPQLDKIDAEWLNQANHYRAIATEVSGRPAWGLISAPLGNKTNRVRFIKNYFDGKRRNPEQDPENAPVGMQNEPADQAAMFEPSGFEEALRTYSSEVKPMTPGEKEEVWRKAVEQLNGAIEEAKAIEKKIQIISDSMQIISMLRERETNTKEALMAQQREVLKEQGRLLEIERLVSKAIKELEQVISEEKAHHQKKPRFWENLITLWGAFRRWKAILSRLEAQIEAKRAGLGQQQRELKKIEAQSDHAKNEQRNLESEFKSIAFELTQRVQATIKDARAIGSKLILKLLGDGAPIGEDELELAEPWHSIRWRKSRAKVFLEALRLQRIFFQMEPNRIRSNLQVANKLLEGKVFENVDQKAIRSAWATLFMVVPVLSSTFASFARTFKSLGVSEIGYLIVDEAGQATPQAAVGALMRAKNALIVGDPIQLKPILSLTDPVLEHLRNRYRLPAHWLPNKHSAQTLADQATPLGRIICSNNAETWVGLPLRVHRRCDKPMFDLANKIAYDDTMVYGTIAPAPNKETKATILTGWIDVKGKAQGNWVPAEGVALQNLLRRLISDGVAVNNIAVITPFTDVKRGVTSLKIQGLTCGTIHTMQGKESEVVILVLGGNTDSDGARNWAVSEPNLLNVAATRAKRRFYVIGDRDSWKRRNLFRDVMHLLPSQNIEA